MAKGFKKGAGGGNPLNFKIVAYATDEALSAATPKKNTIGVVTTTAIPGWYFSAEQPENMAEGEVWFCTAKSSTFAFNALKKNCLQIYPVSAKQMVSGALVDVSAKSWLDGAWVEWIKEGSILIEDGVSKKTIFVCWEGTVKEGGHDYATITEGDGYVTVAAGGYGTWAVFISDVDLTYANNLVINGQFPSSGVSFCVWDNVTSAPNSDNSIANSALTSAGGTLDVSALTGVYKVGYAWGGNLTTKISDFRFT